MFSQGESDSSERDRVFLKAQEGIFALFERPVAHLGQCDGLHLVGHNWSSESIDGGRPVVEFITTRYRLILEGSDAIVEIRTWNPEYSSQEPVLPKHLRDVLQATGDPRYGDLLSLAEGPRSADQARKIRIDPYQGELLSSKDGAITIVQSAYPAATSFPLEFTKTPLSREM